MDIRGRNAVLDRLGRLGKSGGLSVQNDPKGAIDELQRRTATLSEALSQLYGEVFRGPRAGENADIFTIDCRSGGNVLNSGEAQAEGLGNFSKLCVFRHGRGYVLDYYTVIRHFLNNPATVAPTPPNRMGNIELFAVDDNRTVFRVDADADSQEAVITVLCWPSKVIPTSGINPSVTGASRGKNGYIRATEL